MIAYEGMKHGMFPYAALAAFFLVLTGLGAQQGPREVDSTDELWKLVRYELGGASPQELQAVESAILSDTRGGWLPVGIDKAPEGGLEVFYILSDSLPFERVKLFPIADIARIQRNIDDLIWDGWVPVALGVDAGDPILLFIDTPAIEVEDWDIRMTFTDAEAIEFSIMEMREKGFSGWGASEGPGGTLWLLFILEGNRSAPRPLFLNHHGLEMEGLRRGLETDILNGWIPWAYFMGSDSRYIQYTR